MGQNAGMVDVGRGNMRSVIVHGTSTRCLALLALALVSGCSESSEADPAAGGGGSGMPTGGSGGTAGSASGAAGGGSGGAAGSASGGSAGMPSDGICRPMLVQPAANPNAVVLVSGAVSPLGGIGGPHVAGDMIIYTDDDGIARIPKAGGTPERLFSDPEPLGIYVENELAYFIRDNALYSVSATAPSTTATTVLATFEYSPATDGVIGIDATNLYLSVRATNEIRAIELTTGTVTPLVTGVENSGWRLANGFIYFVGPYDSIRRVAVTGGAAETLHVGDYIVWSIGVDGNDIYYGSSGSLHRAGTPETTLLSWDIDFVVSPRPVGNRILFGGREGAVGWVMKDASSCQGIAESRFNLGGWDVDESNVFVTAEDVMYRIPL